MRAVTEACKCAVFDTSPAPSPVHQCLPVYSPVDSEIVRVGRAKPCTVQEQGSKTLPGGAGSNRAVLSEGLSEAMHLA